ncbi:MAG: murein biosynthesis integral membrane protein MurJ [Clostridia bacterium]|nr:murein biosynthesis integral membrane protein MurJ [Clostridia bacterium]
MLRTAGFIAMATLLAKACGLVRDSMLAGYFSAGTETDAFMMATKLPTMLFDIVIGGVISASFIPIFNSVRENDGRGEAEKFASRFIMMIVSAAALISVLGILFSDQLVQLIAPGFSGDKHILTAKLTAIMFPMIIFTGLAFSFVGLLQSYGEFNIPAVISLVSNLVIIAYFPLLADRFGIYGLAYTMLAAWSLQVLIQIPSLIKFRFRFRPDFRFRDKNIAAAVKLALPMLVSTWIQPLYSVINARLASGISGAATELELANRLYVVMTGVFSFVVTNLIFPKVAKANAEKNEEEAKALIVISIKSMFFILLPLTLGVIVLARPITGIIYEHNKFDSESAARVANALRCYSVGMAGLAVNEVLSKYFFSMKNSKTPMRNSIISMAVNIVLAYILFYFFKTPGLALAAAAGSICNASINAFSLRDKQILAKSDIQNILKMFICTAAMTAVIVPVYSMCRPEASDFAGNILACAVCGGTGVIVYFVLSFLLRVDILQNFFKKKGSAE